LSFLRINDVNIFYQAKGHGIPIVFIHPPLLTSTNFTYQLQDLSTDFQTVVFDIRGHGKSSYSKEPITYSLIAKDIIQLLDYLKIDKALICGYSTGGSIALEFLLTYPERALRGILISAMSEVNDWILKKEIKTAVSMSNRITFSTLASGICFTNADNKKVLHDLLKDAKKGQIENIKQYYKYSLNYNCTNQLHKLNMQILSLYGENNKQFHPYAHLINQRLPENELIFIKDGRHHLPTKSAEEVNHYIKLFANKFKR
jgi:pimeloyl-ACP methyl ester carboxylesterase